MANTVKCTAFLRLLSLFHFCYSSSRPRPDDATVVISFGINEQDFQKKEQEFSQKLREARPPIQFEEGDSFSNNLGRAKFYKVKLTYDLLIQVKTIAKELGIDKVAVVPTSVSIVTVEYTFPSEEFFFKEKLKEADIVVIRQEEWLRNPSSIFYSFYSTGFPRDQEYIVAGSLKSETEAIAEREGILKRISVYEKPKYVTIKFSMGPDKVEFLKRLNEEYNIQLREINRILRPGVPREFLVMYYAIYRLKAIAKELGISDIVYNKTILSPVFLTYTFSSDGYEFEEKLKEVNIHFEKFESPLEKSPKVTEYIVEARLIDKVQEIAHTLDVELS